MSFDTYEVAIQLKLVDQFSGDMGSYAAPLFAEIQEEKMAL